MAGFLLAGGVFSTADAERIMDAAEKEGQLFYVKVNDKSPASGGGSCLDPNGKDFCVPFSETNMALSSMWSVEKVTSEVNGVDKTVGYKLVNALTGKPLQAIEGGVIYDTFTGAEDMLFMETSNWGFSGVAEGNLAKTDCWFADLTEVKPLVQTEGQLNAWNGSSFDLDICYEPLKDDAIDPDKKPESYTAKGNVFAETVYAEGNSQHVTTETQYALYQKNSKKRIVLLSDKWGDITNSLEEAGYKFAALKEKEYAEADNILADEFIITKPATTKGEPVEVVAVDKNDPAIKYELVVSGVDGTYYVTAGKDNTPGVAEYTAKTTGNNTYVKFGKGNLVDNDIFIGKIWEIRKNGKIASPKCGEGFISTTQVATGYPEGQWLWNDETEVFVNRESGKELPFASLGLRETEEEGVYVNGDDEYTIIAVGTPGESEIGYLHGYTNDQLKRKAFLIGAPIEATGDIIYLSKTSNGVLKFSEEKANAIEFRLTPSMLDKDHQSVQIRNAYTALEDGEKTSKTDVISFTRYTITDAVSGEELYYDSKEGRYVLATEEDADKQDLEEASKFLIKNKGVDTYNILFFAGNSFSVADEDAFHYVKNGAFCTMASKLLGAFNVSELVKARNAYDLVQNDLFVIEPADANQYRGDFSDTGVLDTIKIFRNDNDSYVLYEQSGFLAMENIYDIKFENIKPAMLADTAFHADTYRPQYMLAVGARIVPEGTYCPVCGEDDCAHAEATKGYIEGRYLVNLVDSAKACENPYSNKFTYEYYDNNEEPYYRLGFVNAKHLGDSLIISSDEPAAKDTIDVVSNSDHYKVCTFAFKYVDGTRDAFTIETVYDYGLDNDGDYDADKYKAGYIKYHNGVPVVTPNPSEAWTFNLEELTGINPTANEDIAISNVTVIAGEGQVVVKGAAGKTVSISNILGQVVANTVLSSDEATIAAPAGVIVVAVEGEEAVKAIIK